LTPSVSSSKNLRSPALDAGIGAFFFLPLTVLLRLYRARTLLKCVVQQGYESNGRSKTIISDAGS
jgi:hypothetical protein